MMTINKLKINKLLLGIILIAISVIGLIPLIIGGDTFSVTSKITHGFNTDYHSKGLSETYYPIMLGLFALAGSIIIVSEKKEQK